MSEEALEGWKVVRLWDCGTWLSGGTPATDEPRFWQGDIPWISAASLKEFRLRESDRCITQAGSRAGTKMVQEGTVIFVVRGMSLKTEFRIGVAERDLAFGQDCKAIIPRAGIDGNFLALAMKARSRQILSMVDEAGHGTGRLPTDLIANLAIRVPPIAEQQRITEIVDDLDARIATMNGYIAKLGNVGEGLLTEGLIRSFIAAESADSDVPLARIAEIRSGVTLGAEPSGSGTTELPYLRVANVQDGFIDTTEMKTMRILRIEFSRYLLAKGDVLLTEGGDLDKLGRGAVWDGRIEQCAYQNHIFCVRSDRSKILPEYLAAYAGSNFGKAYFLRIAKQTTNLASINSTQLKAMPIPLPHLEEQMALVRQIQAHRLLVEAERRSLMDLRALKQGLMDDLLTGRVRVPGPG